MQSQRAAITRPLRALLLVLTLLVPGMAIMPAVRASSLQAPTLATGSGNIELENLDRVPYNDRLVFQRINSGWSGYTHNAVTLKIKNTADTPLTVSSITISGTDNTCFTISSADAQGFTIAPNSARDILVRFVAGGKGTTRGMRQATLFIQSSDPETPTTPVQLAGFNMITDQGENEPSLQEILDTFGYSSLILYPGEGQKLNSKFNGNELGTYMAVGEEVLSPRWLRADGSKPVYVRQLAAFFGSPKPEPVSVTGSGGGTVAMNAEHFQSFFPRTATDLPTELTINPSTSNSFEIRSAGYSSDRDPSRGHGVRFWPARDRNGVLIPNTYLFGQDYVGSSSTNYDYQDNVYLITNVRPANQARDPNVAGQQPGAANLVLEFDRNDYPNTLQDKDGTTTGFPITQRNERDITSPHLPPSTSYDAAKLDLNTGGQGTLTIRTSAGSNTGNDNTLVNALCTPFDGRTGKFVVSTRLLGPANVFATAYQQGGLMFGPSQANFLKLTAGAQVTGTEPGKPWVQFFQEINGVSSQIGSLVSIPNPGSLTSLDLQLTADAATGKVEAAYRINDGILVNMPTSVMLTGTDFGRFFDPQSKGCIMASHKNASEIGVVFDRFAITRAPVDTNLPVVNAGPDQKVPVSSVVTLNGTATDSTGAPLTGNWEQVSGSQTVTLDGSGNSRTFTAPGSYRVLTFAFAATDSQNRSASDTVTITVGNQPIEGLTVSTNSPVDLGTRATLSASVTAGSGPITYRWDFGDNTPAITGGSVVSHNYAALGNYVVTVTATNPAGNVSKQTTVTVQTAVPEFAFRYNAGDKTVTTNGATWKTDKGLFTPSAPNETRGTPEIANTIDDALYHDYRGKVSTTPRTMTYEIPLNSQLNIPEGTRVLADVRLHFAELYWGVPEAENGSGTIGVGKRVFDVSIEGVVVLDNFDIFAAAGNARTAVIRPINGISVTDGTLTIALTAVEDYVAISAFEILSTPKPPPENNGPSADAGADQTVLVGTPVTLTGSGSDPDGDTLTYSWQQTSGPTATLDGNGAVRTFTPTVPGSYIFTLTTTDTGNLSGADTVVITVNDVTQPINNPPTANAGEDQIAILGSTITITGSGSDPDGNELTYNWQQTGGDPVTLVGDAVVRTFTPTSSGSFIFTFTTTDTGNLSGADTVVITITEEVPPDNQPPTANAGIDQTVKAGDPVILSGTGSSDPEDGFLNYNWQQIDGPTVELSNSTSAEPTFTAPATATVLTFQLIVTDNFGLLSLADEVQITVVEEQPVPVDEFQLFLPLVSQL